jgi:DNA polymerase II small subunit
MIETSSSIGIINEKFNRNSLFLTTDSVELLATQEPDRLDEFIEYLRRRNVVFVGRDQIDSFFYPQVEAETTFEYTRENLPLDDFVPSTPLTVEHDFRIIKDVTRKALSEGTCKNFVNMFQSRYHKLSRMFRAKPTMRDFQPLSLVKKMKIKDMVKTVGMVTECATTRNGHTILTLEDETDSIKALLHSRNETLAEQARTILTDEVVGVSGILGQDIIFVNHLEFPDIPGRDPNHSAEDIWVAVTSDLHVGSSSFMEKAFLRFIRWLNLKYDHRAEIARKIQYLLVVGDLVDGVGIYPGQEDDLIIPDIKAQYQKLAALFKLIPPHITLILAPGNHDATRIAEPQLPILEEYAPDLYSMENVRMVGNPCFLDLHSVKVLLYHGGSLFDFLALQKEHDDASVPMVEMLKKRHLCPVYGNVPIAPSEEDLLVIEDVPDLFITGHIHVNSHQNYRGTTVLNAGCWMEQSEYQKTRNINPTPCRVPILNLKTYNMLVMDFGA